MQIRVARAADASAINAIYRPFVENTSVSFELEPPSDAVMEERIRKIQQRLPWLVCEDEGIVCGYAYVSPFRDRPAYQWSAETSVYVDSHQHRRGIGRALYTELLQLLVQQGYYTAYACITLPNVASVALHEAFGFEPIGVFRSAGHKFGAWWDVGWWQKPLRSYVAPASAPAGFTEIWGVR